MRELFRGLIEADKELPRTMVIAQLHWRRLAAPAHYEQVKQKREWYETTLARGETELRAVLKALAPTKLPIAPKLSVHPVVIPKQVTPWHTFSRVEILDFVTAVKDENSIHQQEKAVVPGCLVLERLYQYITVELGETVDTMSVRFRRPTFVDEMVSIIEERSCIQGYTAERAVFTCTWS